MQADRIDDAQLLAVLKATFGYTTFRPLQEDIVRAILAGQDVFVLMPTGAGKSLCYQLPALLRDGVTVVVSPLIALMKDQVDGLAGLGVAATYINSSLDSAEIGRRQAAVARGEVKLLYVAPERLMQPGFLRLLSATPLAGFAIDEAHCISEWGHDFRPEYRALRRLREHFPNVPFGAFTATATRRVQADIRAQLGLDRAACFQGSYNRPNLYYEVRPKKRAYEQLVAYLRARGAVSGIIYCASRAETERLAARLCASGFRAAAYHAGLESEDRRRRQEAFIRDDVRIMVATIAFGMGIDKPDVRFVIHYDLPKSMEGYYQESGRAGRDGDPAECLLFYSYGDAAKQRHFIEEKPSETERRIAHQQLRRMIDWAESHTCRRRALLAYFDEHFEGQSGECCDVCRSPVEEVDSTIPAQMFLSCVVRTGERFGIAHVTDVLRGSENKRVRAFRHDRLSTYGIGRDRSREEWHHLARELLRGGYLHQAVEEFNALKLTERARAVLLGKERVLTAVPRSARQDREMPATHPHADLFDRLRALRKRLADERSIPPYAVFHDTTLREIAATLPTDRAALLRIHGVGERKAADYGEAVLAEVAAYVRATGAQPSSFSPTRAAVGEVSNGITSTVLATLQLFQAGRSVAEIARERHLTPSTVEGHLAEAIAAGEQLDLERLVSTDKRRAIEAAIAVVGSERLKPILEYLGDGYTYAELRFVRSALSAAGE